MLFLLGFSPQAPAGARAGSRKSQAASTTYTHPPARLLSCPPLR
jgi:hypothetical protein